jgi:protein-disulfide isomerase
MNLTSETKLFLGVFAFTAVLIIGAIVIFSKPPKPILKSELVTPSAYTRGNKDAADYLVEFSDFQCPACKAFSGEVGKLGDKYPDKLLIVYRNFPLPQHEFSKTAAMVAEAAGQQNKFWEMEKLLFDNQESFSDEKFASLAAELKLDMTKFNSALNDGKIKDKIQADVDYGNRIGINATPTFYLNGIKLELNTPTDLTAAVEKAINK